MYSQKCENESIYISSNLYYMTKQKKEKNSLM